MCNLCNLYKTSREEMNHPSRIKMKTYLRKNNNCKFSFRHYIYNHTHTHRVVRIVFACCGTEKSGMYIAFDHDEQLLFLWIVLELKLGNYTSRIYSWRVCVLHFLNVCTPNRTNYIINIYENACYNNLTFAICHTHFSF